MPTMTTIAPAFHVYVIGLDPGVLDRAPFVGQSTHDGETRFRQHREGYKANSYVRDFGRHVLSEMGRALGPDATREGALREEARLAEELRERGFAVWSR